MWIFVAQSFQYFVTYVVPCHQSYHSQTKFLHIPSTWLGRNTGEESEYRGAFDDSKMLQ